MRGRGFAVGVRGHGLGEGERTGEIGAGVERGVFPSICGQYNYHRL